MQDRTILLRIVFVSIYILLSSSKPVGGIHVRIAQVGNEVGGKVIYPCSSRTGVLASDKL